MTPGNKNAQLIKTAIKILEIVMNNYKQEFLDELKNEPKKSVWEILVRKIKELDGNYSDGEFSTLLLKLFNASTQDYNNPKTNPMVEVLRNVLPKDVSFRLGVDVPKKEVGDSVFLRAKFFHKGQEIEVNVVSNIHSLIENLGKDEDQRYLVGKNASVAPKFDTSKKSI